MKILKDIAQFITIGGDSFGGRNLMNKAFWTFREARENLFGARRRPTEARQPCISQIADNMSQAEFGQGFATNIIPLRNFF